MGSKSKSSRPPPLPDPAPVPSTAAAAGAAERSRLLQRRGSSYRKSMLAGQQQTMKSILGG